MKIIRTAIIGQGRSGRDIHGAYLKQVPHQFKIVATVDPIEERRIRAEKEFNCKSYEDYREILKLDDIDLIINATPSHLHVPVTLDILNGNFNVLCEKPLARRVEEVDLLIDTAKRSGKVFAIYQQSRYAPYFKQVRKIINSGIIGRIVQVSIAFNGFSRRWDWQCLQKNNGGNLLNTGPHPLDQALQLFGTDIMPEVYCIMDRCNTYGDAEDYVKLILRGEGRPVIDIEISSCCAYPTFTYNVQGTRGGIKGNMTHIDWKYFKEEEAPPQKLTTRPLEKPDGTPAYCNETLKWYEESWDLPEEKKDLFNTMSEYFYNMLYKTLTEGTPLEITPQEIRQQVSVIEEAHRQNPLSAIC